jgi:hypothetical protein
MPPRGYFLELNNNAALQRRTQVADSASLGMGGKGWKFSNVF